MKLVREHIYEKFTEDSDPIADLGIGTTQLEEILGIWLTRSEGKYMWKGNIDLKGTHITELPDNLHVGGYLDLRRTQITELPDNLHVGSSLYLGRTQITELPNNGIINTKMF
jgi:hypothetical protein